jgi:hypothetical protein
MRRQLPSLLIIFVFVSWFAVVSAASFAQSQSPAVAQPAGADASSPSPQPNAVPATPKTSAKVWTNDDIGGLRNDQQPVGSDGTQCRPQERERVLRSPIRRRFRRTKTRPGIAANWRRCKAEIDKLDPQIAKAEGLPQRRERERAAHDASPAYPAPLRIN